ncbi:MAG: ubiA [Gammaproteobacteria bacterium]|jgi:4-hydroxybenzoate polyprenyltransferase|nr:ubiA [Gammaproteobacteria bacterium]
MQRILFYLKLMRFHRPVGILLLLWPTLWALWLANQGFPPIKLLIIFILGTVVTRAAGCIINDLCDQDFDRHVQRTQDRPLTSGKISRLEAFSLLLLLSLLALALALQLNLLSIFISILAAIVASIYPLMKRITHFPQVVLGVAFSMGVPMAYAASLNHIPTQAWELFAICILWPLMYDTAYAMTDAEDDKKIGIKSTALFFGSYNVLFIGILQGLFWLGLGFIGLQAKLPKAFFLSLGISGILLIYQQYLLRRGQPFKAFLNNQWLGLIIWIGCVLSFL